MKTIYLDHAATTPVCGQAFATMLPYFGKHYGNADSMHSAGRQARQAVTEARAKIAQLLGVKPAEIYFTSGGTESDNWAIRGMAHTKGRHIISSQIEHPAVYETLKLLQKQGVKVTLLPVNSDGIVDQKSLEAVINPDVSLVSIMMANNEVGTIQPIKELAEIAHRHKVAFHTDAVQAVGNIPVDIPALGVDMMSFSAHKFYGPKGIGALYIRGGVKPDRLVSGGHQERTRRGGTTNVAFAAGMAAALETAITDMDANTAHIGALRDELERQIGQKVPHVRFNGDRKNRVPGIANVSLEFIEGESILMSLDMAGIACSTGSACSSGSLEPSHVLLAMGVPLEIAHGSIRFSLGRENTAQDITFAADKLAEIAEKLRKMSPLFIQLKGETQNV